MNMRVWVISVLDPDFKEFCFKLLQGRLYLNLALSHFSDTSPGCTFCTIKKKRELKNRGIERGTPQYEIEVLQVEPETIEHLMWLCPEVNGVIKEYVNELAGTRQVNVSRYRYWEGCELEFNIDSMLSMLIVRFIQYVIYRCRLRIRLLLIATLRYEVGNLIGQLAKRTKWVSGIQRMQVIMQQLLERD
jgi:hypothetical protein